MEVVDQDQNQMAAVGAIAPSGVPQPSVFKLDADCWDEVFDCLSIGDVHSFGQTCKTFQRVTGEYFKWKYEAVIADCEEDGISIDDKQMNGFSAFVQKIQFYENTTDSMLLYVESDCKAVKHMKFVSVDFTRLTFELIQNLLSKIEVLKLYYCKFDGERFGALIESCVNLKRLTLECAILPLHKHPTLEHLQFYSTLENNELKTFLEQSPKLRSLDIHANHLWESRVSILDANIELNDLTVHLGSYFQDGPAAFVDLLNELYQRRFYKRLHLRSNLLLSHDQLLALPGLVTLRLRQAKADYPLLINVKEFAISDGREMYINPTVFINAEGLFIWEANVEDILPFVRHLLKLKAIHIYRFKEEVLDVCALNKERTKLLGSQKVTIYVNEKAYLATKWASKGITFDLIEIRRKSSYKIIRPYSLGWNDGSI